MRSREQRRTQLVRDILDGADPEPGTALGDARLRPAAAPRGAWCRPRTRGRGAGAGPGARRAAPADRLARRRHEPGRGSGGTPVRAAGADRGPRGRRLSFGEPASGAEGFRASHRQARDAHRVAIRGHGGGDPLRRGRPRSLAAGTRPAPPPSSPASCAASTGRTPARAGCVRRSAPTSRAARTPRRRRRCSASTSTRSRTGCARSRTPRPPGDEPAGGARDRVAADRAARAAPFVGFAQVGLRGWDKCRGRVCGAGARLSREEWRSVERPRPARPGDRRRRHDDRHVHRRRRRRRSWSARRRRRRRTSRWASWTPPRRARAVGARPPRRRSRVIASGIFSGTAMLNRLLSRQGLRDRRDRHRRPGGLPADRARDPDLPRLLLLRPPPPRDPPPQPAAGPARADEGGARADRRVRRGGAAAARGGRPRGGRRAARRRGRGDLRLRSCSATATPSTRSGRRRSSRR